MKHIVVDLEMNPIKQNSKEKSHCSMETIEIGAVMLDDRLQEISSFRTYVKPELNSGIASRIRKLTGITTEMVESAPHFNEALRMFLNWCIGTGDEVTIYAWSNTDYNQIQSEIICKGFVANDAEEELLSVAWTDFQHEFDVHLGFERQVSLKMALDLAGVDFTGREHDALDDARNTAELLQIVRDEVLFNNTLLKIEEVMKPSSLENTLGSMFDFSEYVFA